MSVAQTATQYRDPSTNETLLEMHQRICFEFDDIHTKDSYHAWLDWLVSKGSITAQVRSENQLH